MSSEAVLSLNKSPMKIKIFPSESLLVPLRVFQFIGYFPISIDINEDNNLKFKAKLISILPLIPAVVLISIGLGCSLLFLSICEEVYEWTKQFHKNVKGTYLLIYCLWVIMISFGSCVDRFILLWKRQSLIKLLNEFEESMTFMLRTIFGKMSTETKYGIRDFEKTADVVAKDLHGWPALYDTGHGVGISLEETQKYENFLLRCWRKWRLHLILLASVGTYVQVCFLWSIYGIWNKDKWMPPFIDLITTFLTVGQYFSFFLMEYFLTMYNWILGELLEQFDLCCRSHLRLRMLLNCHRKLEDEIDRFNEFFGSIMIVKILFATALFISMGYFVITTFFFYSSMLGHLYMFLNILAMIAPILIIGNALYKVSKLSSDIKKKSQMFVRRLEENGEFVKRGDFTNSISRLSSNPLTVGNNFFNFNLGLLLKMMGAVTMYLMVFTQFQLMDST